MVISSLRVMQQTYAQNSSAIRNLESQCYALQQEYSKEMRQLAADQYMQMLAAKNGDPEAAQTGRMQQFLAQLRASQKAARIKTLKLKALDLSSENRLLQASMRKEINDNAGPGQKIDHIPEHVLTSGQNFDAFVRTKVEEEPVVNYGEIVRKRRREGKDPVPTRDLLSSP